MNFVSYQSPFYQKKSLRITGFENLKGKVHNPTDTLKLIFNFILSIAVSYIKEWNQKRFAIDSQPKEYQRGIRIPQETNLFHGMPKYTN